MPNHEAPKQKRRWPMGVVTWTLVAGVLTGPHFAHEIDLIEAPEAPAVVAVPARIPPLQHTHHFYAPERPLVSDVVQTSATTVSTASLLTWSGGLPLVITNPSSGRA